MFSIANIASVRDVAAIGQRNRDAVPPTAKVGVQEPKTTDASAETKVGNGDPSRLGPKRLTPDQERLVQELAQTDQKVRAHEAAHQAAASSLGGAVSFSYATGPDGRSYAVGGEVPVDMSSGRTPEETLSKAEQIRAAALAPADPSPQDLSVAAQASQMEASARAQLMQQQLAALHAGKSGHSQQPASVAASPDGKLEGSPNEGSSKARVPDVGAQSASTLAALESDRASAGTTGAQVQQFARLAVAAYGM